MTCFHPLKGWKSRYTNQSGKRSITFERSSGFVDIPMEIPCGQCIGCKLERSRQWAIRCVHEAQMHEDNSFITLTYNDENLPENGSLDIRHFQLFMKKLRKALASKKYHKICLEKGWDIPPKIRFYACGEYGAKYERPHYHACIFGHAFPDKIFYKYSNGIPLYRSSHLENIWTLGFSTVGSLTFQSAAYVARYITEKITGDKAEAHYQKEYTYIDPTTGEVFDLIFDRKPEYTNMSRADGIGNTWFKTFISDVYPSDEVIMNQHSMRPPKYYDGLYEIKNKSDYKRLKRRRKKSAKNHSEDQTPDRLKVREAVQKTKLKLLPRKVE